MHDEIDVTFGEWLGDQLEARGLIQMDLAERTGFGTSTISRWLSDEITPRGPACDRIADALGIDRNVVRKRANRRGVSVDAPPGTNETLRTLTNRMAGVEAELERIRRLLEREDEQG